MLFLLCFPSAKLIKNKIKELLIYVYLLLFILKSCIFVKQN